MSCRSEWPHIDDVTHVLRGGACCAVCRRGGLCDEAVERTRIMLATADMIEGLIKERDALLADLRDAEVASCDCLHCKHYKTLDDDCSTECDTCEIDCRCKVCIDNNKWEWRGVRED